MSNAEGGSGNADASAADGSWILDAALPAIDPSEPVANLTDAQRASLCDWLNAELGGYGVSTNCGGPTTVANAPDQAYCIAHQLKFRCPFTVGQLEACVMAESSTHGCIQPDVPCKAVLCQ